MAAAKYIVTVPLVIARVESGQSVYLYQGATVPDEVTADEVKRLAKEKFIEREKAAPQTAGATLAGGDDQNDDAGSGA